MTAPGDQQPDSAELELVWPENIGNHAVPINQFLVAYDQGQPDLVYLYLGLIGPMPWITEAQARQRVAELGSVLAVEAKGSYVVSRTRATEFWTILGRHLGLLPPDAQPPIAGAAQ